MKSSTLHRSNLTKERMELLREIKAQKRVSTDSAPGIYVRPAKEKELDVLWQSFKVNQKDEKSPAVYMVTGFIAGALAMFILTAIISFAAHSASDEGSLGFQSIKAEKIHTPEAAPAKPAPKAKANAKDAAAISFLPPDTAKASPTSKGKTEQYTIKAGDTLDSIAVRFYGKYDSTLINKIASANNLQNPHQIRVGQVLTIPID